MRSFEIVESVWSALPLTDDEAASLQALGERLVSMSEYAIIESQREEDVDITPDRRRSAIHCAKTSDHKWKVRVAERVGVIVCGDLQIHVLPKIDSSHVVYLMRCAVSALRDSLTMEEARALVHAEGGFWEIVCHGFITAAERVLSNDLVRDYEGWTEELPVVRGRVLVGATARRLLQGTMRFSCEFEEFTSDVPINRLLRAAVTAVVRSPLLSKLLRRRAMRLFARLGEVGEMRPGDRRKVILDRRTAHYKDSVELADLVLSGGAQAWLEGTVPSASFLVQTPGLVEVGVRKLLDDALRPLWPVKARSLPLGGISETINPDLVFGRSEAVADVKYKIGAAKWNRPDLYEVVAFAEHLGTDRAAIIDFGDLRRPSVTIGEITISHFAWNWIGQDPAMSALDLIKQVEEWLPAQSNL